MGPAESHHDSLFLLESARPVAFAGDLAYGLTHAYMADGHNADWARALDRLAVDLPEDLPQLIGQGAPVTPSFLRWQRLYLDQFDVAIFAQLSIEPNARALGLWRQPQVAWRRSRDLAA